MKTTTQTSVNNGIGFD